MASSTYPLAKKGAIIGSPYSGTHTLGNWQSDNAIDIAAPVGTPVYAVADGVIGPKIGPLGSKNPRFAGDRVYLQFGDNQAYYGHLSKLVVKAGEHVTDGQLLGYSGEANGVAHLHFSVKNGSPGDVVRGAIPPAQAQPAQPTEGVATAAPTMVEAPTLGTPPAAADPVPEMPGTAQHYLPGQGGAADSWQALSALSDLSPDTQRMIELASGG